MRLAALPCLVIALSACGSSKPSPDDGPPLDMASAGGIAPPKKLCELVGTLPTAGRITSPAEALRAAGVSVPPPGDDGFDAGCQLDAFQCRAMHVSIFKTADDGVQHLGFNDAEGVNYFVIEGFETPEDGTCGTSGPPKFDTIFGGPIAVAMRTFEDCQSAMDYHDWFLFHTGDGEAVARLTCQGPASIAVDDDGKITVTCRGKRFTTTRDALMACYAG